MLDKIIVRGAREHNLKNITLEIPRNKFTVITGLSGSGKSTLAFDTIYAEGQRRYVESLSAYARQFLGLMNKPDVDSIEGLSPAISIEQKTTSKNPRSTVGTVTEIYDYLRLLFARIGIIHCPKCNAALRPLSPETIVNLIMADYNKQLFILAPIIRGIKGTHEKVFEDLSKDGFTRVRVNGTIYRLDEVKEKVKLERYEKHWIEAVVDRITVNDENRLRLSQAVEQALHKANGTLIVLDPDQKFEDNKKKELERGAGETIYSTFGACPTHTDIIFEQLEPRMFSFNSPFGACPTCLGLGEHMELDPDLVIPDKELSIMDGAIAIYGKFDLKWRAQQIGIVAKAYKFDLFTPIKKLTPKQLEVLLYGTDESLKGRWSNGAKMNMEEGWEGVIPQTMRLYKSTESNHRKEHIERLMISRPCQTCRGKRLKENILAVKVQGESIIDVTDLSIEHSLAFFQQIPKTLTPKEQAIAKQVLKEVIDRLTFLNNVGLGYLTLSRSARTLSGGEAQRIRLATQIGANLMGVVYILDEPSIGLHQRDNHKLITTLHRLRDIGNTLIVVEHDEDTIRQADHVIDMGPGAGVHGGYITAQGTPQQVASNDNSLTGQYLIGTKKIETPENRKTATHYIELTGAKENNLKDVSVFIPTEVLCGITGVSGSGKSTLINQTLRQALKKHFGEVHDHVGTYGKLVVPPTVQDIIVIDQDPIGKTPRSNPATYTKLFDEIRLLFAATKESRARGYKEGRFSFNVRGGRCEACEGDGVIKIEMNFLPDVYVQCEECKGKRYNRDTLGVTYKEKSIAEVLNMSVEEALTFFENISGMKRKLQTLYDVGLGYIKLGQSSTTLSGGESQRIKLTKELAKVKKGKTLYILDEPTTGLHFEDVRKLIIVLNRLVEKGNSVIVIEHNLDVIKCCDYLIDLGPEGGDKGGVIIAQGTPEEVAKVKESYTGQFLKGMLKK
ncbi:excinuclease ABC subunit UvrA [Candidatus Woesearchaeota archaeon]|nr:excinuclease ABC subunit UvrA [Candidatus Woesearchaeota archaeon]